ncbi:MAG: metallophosphoesterase family protein [Anaerolineae bacterium]
MAEAIRVLHFADVHIGMENYGKTDADSGLSSRVVDFLRRMDEMVDYARDNDVDLVIFAGDAFKTRNPNPTYQREFAWRIQDLAELAPVVMLVGNHDLPPNALKASSIEIYDTLRVPNVFIAHEYDVFDVETKRGRVVIGSAPYPIRSRLMQETDLVGRTIRDTDQLLEETLGRLLVKLADDADALAGDDTPRIMTGHFTVHGAVLGSERNVMLGRDVQVSLSLLADPRWDYVALGHIHKYQNLTPDRDELPDVVYSGSLERIDFGEENDSKGFCWVSLARHQTAYEYVRVLARPMVTLRADCRTEAYPTRTVTKLIRESKLEDAIVRVIIELTPETNASLKDGFLRRELLDAGVFHIAGIKRNIERPERARLGTNPEGLTHEELLERYLISREITPEQRALLNELAREIMAPQSVEGD